MKTSVVLAPRSATTTELLAINKRSEAAGYNRTLSRTVTAGIARFALHRLKPVLIHQYKHGKSTLPHLRVFADVQLGWRADPQRVLLDLSFDDFEHLPTV